MSDNPYSSQEETSLNGDQKHSLSSDEKNMAMFCHLGAFAGFIFPFGGIIVPFVIWIMKRDDSEFVNYHGKESLNFQITMAIAFIISLILTVILIGFVLLAGLAIFELVVVIVASIKASEGNTYIYPFSIRFIK
ncbi:DUF4870 domain-containing protein [Aliikangiella maris]|uniref:DUF4870 domain-containing protein n=2 Tax=Aliikangiella maris TaxID=3162458 RepID=A0ABV3MLP1_9GAMM